MSAIFSKCTNKFVYFKSTSIMLGKHTTQLPKLKRNLDASVLLPKKFPVQIEILKMHIFNTKLFIFIYNFFHLLLVPLKIIIWINLNLH